MKGAITTLALSCGLVVATAGVAAVAGPCSDQIAALDKKVSDNPSLGPPTTGALSGATPAAKLPAANGSATPNMAQLTKGTSAQGNLTKTNGATAEMNAASAQVATSDQDVRRQQAGMPTMANDPNAKLSDSQNKVSQAKEVLEQARALDAKNDTGCQASVAQAQKLLE